MTPKTSPAVYNLDWDTDAVWVQDRSMFVLSEGEDPAGETIKVFDQLGNQISFIRSELEKTHVPVRHATVYKSRYMPKRAFWPTSDVVITIGEVSYEVPAYDVLMQDVDGRVSTIGRHEFNCRYQIVSGTAEKAPFT